MSFGLYGSESWTIEQGNKKRFLPFEPLALQKNADDIVTRIKTNSCVFCVSIY